MGNIFLSYSRDDKKEIGLEFGIKCNARAGVAVFASVDSEATFKVSLKWKNKPKS